MLFDGLLPVNRGLTLAARLLFTSLFLLSGLTHFTNVPYYLSLMPDPVPFPLLWIYLSGVIEFIGAAMILFNWQARLGGWLLVLFLLPVTLVVHGHQLATETDPFIWALQQAHFLKGIALIGAALLITQVGVAQRTST
ncbi:DoxX family membrane protein [Roseibium sp. RKSG952]|uniref:DoxX family membrane protein n=1 Tax=Roseibium sp. RKSG952 TaxID=2529384 RepID=UPI0018AD19B8|nr:DoxX family membrane protein [Roseibium sp. RKSG952]